MFTLGLLFWDRASIEPRCDTHHTSNLVPFIITLYSQRPHLACHYQRSLLFSSMYVWNPSETNMSTVGNSAILVNPIVYTILKTCNPERILIKFSSVISKDLIEHQGIRIYSGVSITNARNIIMCYLGAGQLSPRALSSPISTLFTCFWLQANKTPEKAFAVTTYNTWINDKI